MHLPPLLRNSMMHEKVGVVFSAFSNEFFFSVFFLFNDNNLIIL